MSQSPGTTAALRGRPRNAAVDRAVIGTVLRLLAEGATFADLSMERIARTSGVGKSTMYRRWPHKNALLLDVLAATETPLPEPGDRPVRDELMVILELIRQHSLAKLESALMRSVQAQIQSSPELWQRYYETVVVGRRRVVARVLAHGIARGEISAELSGDVDLLVDMIAGPLLTRTIQRPESLKEEGLVERIVGVFLNGVRPRS